MNIYFIRHGESESNEQNLFAGRFDTPLTALGIEQAKQALARVGSLGILFQEIHHSSLSRAADTAKVLQIGSPQASVIESDSLLERDFGKLSEQNKSLIKKYYGATEFESMFHSFHGKAPGGESFLELFSRAERYLQEVLIPAASEGKNILVVAHKYTIEAFALLAAKIDPRDYQDFRVPNAKVLSLHELADCAKNSSKHMNRLAEETEARLSFLLLGASVLGVLSNLILHFTITKNVEIGILLSLLAINTFFGFLRLHPKYFLSAVKSIELSGRAIAIRLVLGIGLLVWNPHPLLAALGLLFLLPPAGIASTLSLMWGGNFFLASQISVLLAFASPALLILLQVSGYASFSISQLLLITILGTALPTIAAQAFRSRRPMEAGALTTNWSYLGSLAMIALCFFVSFTNSSSQSLNVHPAMVAGILFLLMANRAIAFIASKLSKLKEPERLDIFIQNLAPNIFLLSLFPTIRDSISLPLINIGFFALIYLEERGIVAGFPILAGLIGRSQRGFLRIQEREKIIA